MGVSGSNLRFEGKPDGFNHFYGDGKRLIQLSDSDVWRIFMGVLISFSYCHSQLFNVCLPYRLVY